MGTTRHFELFRHHTRPGWAGPVTISDNLPVMGARSGVTPRKVEGIIVPVDTSTRPGKTPSPFAGFNTGKAMGTDNGHMMALELGGPDISDNIAPQSSLWQQSGGWRKIERYALATAMEWMGMNAKFAPDGPFAVPQVGAYFHVAPSWSFDAITGEPNEYAGGITRISIWQNAPHGVPHGAPPGMAAAPSYGWAPVRQMSSVRMFRITPGGVWWDNEDISNVW